MHLHFSHIILTHCFSGDAGYTNVGEDGNDISDTDPDCSVARPFYPSNRLVFVGLGIV